MTRAHSGAPDLTQAAKDRREARKRLRHAAAKLAGDLTSFARSGDAATVGDTVYEIKNVTYRLREATHDGPPEDAETIWSPWLEKGLLRSTPGAETPALIGDPRETYTDDDGVPWKPLSTVYLAEAEKKPMNLWPDFRVHLATDDELIAFASEHQRVQVAFAKAIAAHTTEIERAVAQLNRGARHE